MSAPARAGALDQHALDVVVDAAAANKAVLVDHSLDAAPFEADDDVEKLAAGRPEGWLCTADASKSPFPGRSLQLIDTGFPSAHKTPVVTRLFHLQRSSELRWLTDAIYDPLEDAWPVAEPWHERDTSMLVASAGAVTSAHSDRHHNLLVELTGTKTIMVLEAGTPGHTQTVINSCPSLNVNEQPAGAREITLCAGQALYVPPFTVHWVTSVDRTVALTCGWRTPVTVRMGEAYAAYATLRGLGLRPRTVGGAMDAPAIMVARAARKVKTRAHAS